MYTLLCYFHQLSASILFIVARLSEKVISIVLVVSCLWCVVQLGWHVCAALIQLSAPIGFKLVIAYRSCRCVSGLYTRLSHIDFNHFFSCDHRLLPMSHDIDCWCVLGVCLFCLFVFVALRPMSTAMVIAGRLVHLTTLFPGQAWASG